MTVVHPCWSHLTEDLDVATAWSSKIGWIATRTLQSSETVMCGNKPQLACLYEPRSYMNLRQSWIEPCESITCCPKCAAIQFSAVEVLPTRTWWLCQHWRLDEIQTSWFSGTGCRRFSTKKVVFAIELLVVFKLVLLLSLGASHHFHSISVLQKILISATFPWHGNSVEILYFCIILLLHSRDLTDTVACHSRWSLKRRRCIK